VPLLDLALFGFLLVAVKANLLIQRRRVGSSRFRLLGNEPGSAEWWSGLLVIAAFACAGAAPVLDLAGSLRPFPALDSSGWQIAGITVWAAGAALARSAQWSMGASWRIGVDPAERLALMIGGPFRLMRNPIYTGLVVLFAGSAMLVPNWASLAAVALLTCGYELLVRRVEEPFLERLHGPSYERYRQSTGRFLPGIGRRP
jgi:protein-S-isoprenylcysteine O-methyltransferase Ste14